jgi:hypothetical protein
MSALPPKADNKVTHRMSALGRKDDICHCTIFGYLLRGQRLAAFKHRRTLAFRGEAWARSRKLGPESMLTQP